jgi:uncharacterized protein (DUF58 family)
VTERPDPEVRWALGRRLPAFAGLGLPVALLDGGTGLGLLTALAYDGALMLGAAFEARRLARRAPEVSRDVGRRLVVGIENEIAIDVHNPSGESITIRVRDDLPPGWEAEPQELAITVPPHARRRLTYTVIPPERGRVEFGDLHVRIDGRARLGTVIAKTPARCEARVYPNILGAQRYELAAHLGDLRHVGFREVRRAGGGGEFEQLREYVDGDSLRDIDWKSTAKRRRPITRTYQQERSQQVMIAIDAGRLMATRLTDQEKAKRLRSGAGSAGLVDEGESKVAISKLDHAINAALLIAYVALRKGDRVGLILFSDVVHRFVPPKRGPGQYRAILEALYDAQASATYVDFRRLVEFIKLRVPKRALLMLFSDLVDESQAGALVEHVPLLRRKHLPVCITMEDHIARDLAESPATSVKSAYRRAAAADVLAERRVLEAHLRKNAVDLVEAPPGELSIATVNKYLEIKARNRL